MDSRTVVRADALFEAGLGLALVLAAVTGALGSSDFPRPVDTAVIVTVGLLLLLLGIVLWQGRIGVAVLAAGNALAAVVAIVWLAAGSGFSITGAIVVLGAAAGLGCLAAAQAATLRT